MTYFQHTFAVPVMLALALLLPAAGFSADYYWVGGSGLWSDHNNHWATASGGNVFHDQVPTSMDNVFFDGSPFLFGGTVVIACSPRAFLIPVNLPQS
jgi:hypothetical protein